MSKTKISVATIGHMPSEFDRRKIRHWRSDIFSIAGEIENHSLTEDSDGDGWEFSDERLEGLLPEQFGGDFLIAIVNVPIELNWYSRRLSKNRVVFTFHEIKDIIRSFQYSPRKRSVPASVCLYLFV